MEGDGDAPALAEQLGSCRLLAGGPGDPDVQGGHQGRDAVAEAERGVAAEDGA
jgi:hypothetical protein